jgi:uncharacterized protein
LRALIGGVKQLSSKETMQTYKLGTSANVLRIKEGLENKEVIDAVGPTTEFIDPLFKLWLQKIYFK